MGVHRYQKQIMLEGFGQPAQERLLAAKVLVVGAGGLGCPALQYLTAMGIGEIGMVDHDSVETSNLHRQVLYTPATVGELKVKVAAQRLKEMNPEVKLNIHPLRVNRSNILDLIKPYDIIFDGTDNFKTRYLVNDATALLKKPLIFAAVSGFEGQLAIFNKRDKDGLSTNYRDLFPVAPAAGEIPNCEELGVLGVMPGIIATLAAGEIVKLITDLGTPLVNKLLHYNLLNHEQVVIQLSSGTGYHLPETAEEFLASDSAHAEAAAHGFTEIGATQLSALQKLESTVVIDLREHHELPLLPVERYKKMPMSKFSAWLNQPIVAQNIILICQHGIRSEAAAEALAEKYGTSKQIYNLKGGIVKWLDYFNQHD